MLLAAGVLAPGAHAAHGALGVANVGVSIVAPVRIESRELHATPASAPNGTPQLVVAVSNEAAANHLPRITVAFN